MHHSPRMLSDRQILGLQYMAVAVLSAWLVVKGIVPAWTTIHSDFGNYYVSAQLVSVGADLDSLYNDDWFHQQMINRGVDTPGKFSPFPPITSWMLLPLSGLQPLPAQRVFVLVNLIFIATCAYVWRILTGWKHLPSLLIILGGGASVANNVAFGQVYLVMVSCLLISIILIGKDRLLPAGILIGTFTAIKYFPIVMIAGLFFLALASDQSERRRYHLTVVYSTLTVVVLALAQVLFFGTGIMKEYFLTALLPHLQSELSGQGMFSYLFQSWDSLGRNLFVYDAQANPDPFLDWPGGRLFLKMLVTVVVFTTTVGVLYVQSASTSSRRFAVFMSMPALAMLVILPASATYHFVLLLLPLGLLLREKVLTTKVAIVAIALYCAIGIIPYPLAFRFSEIAGVVFAYPRLWLVTLLFAMTAWALTRQPKHTVVQ